MRKTPPLFFGGIGFNFSQRAAVSHRNDGIEPDPVLAKLNLTPIQTTMDDLTALVDQAREAFAACKDAAALENAKARYLGKTGALTERMRSLGKLSAADRPAAGARINAAKTQIESL